MIELHPFFLPEQGNWLELIHVLQNDLSLDVYPGGYSAMKNWYHQHAGVFNPIVEDLYGTDVHKIPEELLNRKEWERKFKLYKSDFLPIDLQIHKIKTRNYIIRIPSMERALLEMVDDVGVNNDIERVFEYYTDLAGDLHHKKYQQLLEKCTSERTIRLGLFLAEEGGTDCFPELNLNKIPLSLDKNLDYSFKHKAPNYIFKYNIDVSPNLNIMICEYASFYQKEFLTERAV